jgi:hypothetical protein
MVKFMRVVLAIVSGLITFPIFAIVGGLLWVFLLTRGAIAISLASFIAAMSSRNVSPHVYGALDRAIEFFPRGLRIIWNHCEATWQGQASDPDASGSDLSLAVNILLAAIFIIFFYFFGSAVLQWFGLGSWRLPSVSRESLPSLNIEFPSLGSVGLVLLGVVLTVLLLVVLAVIFEPAPANKDIATKSTDLPPVETKPADTITESTGAALDEAERSRANLKERLDELTKRAEAIGRS